MTWALHDGGPAQTLNYLPRARTWKRSATWALIVHARTPAMDTSAAGSPTAARTSATQAALSKSAALCSGGKMGTCSRHKPHL